MIASPFSVESATTTLCMGVWLYDNAGLRWRKPAKYVKQRMTAVTMRRGRNRRFTMEFALFVFISIVMSSGKVP